MRDIAEMLKGEHNPMSYCIHDYVYADFDHRVCKNCGQAEYYDRTRRKDWPMWKIACKPVQFCENKGQVKQ
jgi:hypothetical protein